MTELTENGRIKNRYVYNALNRLERAESSEGATARYQYNGLGHRTGKEVKDRLNPESRTIIFRRRKKERIARYICGMRIWWECWEMKRGGSAYYLQNEMGSPLRFDGADSIVSGG